MLERTLSPYLRVTLAESVPEALAALTPCVELVLSDILMPGDSGFDLAATLRRDRPDLPVVLFTGVVDLKTRALAQAVGVETVLRKPLLPEQLLKAIHDWLGVPLNRAAPLMPTVSAVQGQPRTALPASRPAAPEVNSATEVQSDSLTEVCQQPGVVSAALLNLAGDCERSWKLPLSPDLLPKVRAFMATMQELAHDLGSAFEAGHCMQLELADRVLLLAPYGPGTLVMVVRDAHWAAKIGSQLQNLAQSAAIVS